MRYIFYVLIAFCPPACYAQQGHYFLSHYTPADERIDHVSYDIAQDTQGILYFATRSGVLQFDGRNWELITGKGAVYSIEINADGVIFWAGANGYGKIQPSPEGKKELVLLSAETAGDYYQTMILEDEVYFVNEEEISILAKDESGMSVSSSNLTGSFSFVFELFGTVYISTDRGVFRLEGPQLRQTSLKLPASDVIFCVKGDNVYLVGTGDNQLFLCPPDLSFRKINLQESQYIDASVIVNASWVNNRLVALGTLRGGVVFINPYTGAVEEIINYNTGLPDNEVLMLTSDKNKNIWAAHDYGFTKISPFLPFRSFSRYDGLKGNLLCATTFNDQVYVGTSLGVFKLVREEVYDEIVYYVDVVTKRETATASNIEEADVGEELPEVTPEEPEKKKRGFFRFLKRNKENSEEKTADGEGIVSPNDEVDNASEKPRQEYITHKLKKTEKILRSSQFAYKKVEGINAKITHLAEVDGKLIAAGLAGVFEVGDLTSASILEEPVRYMFTNHDLVIVSTYADRIRTFRYKGNQWSRVNVLNSLDDQISYIFQGAADEFWLCGLDRIYRLEIKDEDVKNINHINFENPNYSKTIGVRWKNDVLLVNANGFFRYDQTDNVIVHVDSLPAPKMYFTSYDVLWYHDDHSWNVLGQVANQNNIQLLNICRDIRFVSSGNSSGDIWVITASNELYKFFNKRQEAGATSYPLMMKSVTQGDRKLSWTNKLKVDQEEGLLTFEVVHPDYTGVSIEYRYFLKGINDSWSEWTQSNRFSFPYLPPGQYSLQVESRDVFGSIQEMAPLDFHVQPPFWKSPWFYAMEFTVFALLVMLSFQLSVRYRLVSRVLSLLTIILLIEFIQTIAGSTFTTNSSPIIDFLIQVAIAFMILPVESFLRNLMFKSMGKGSRLYQVISDLDRQGKEKKSTKIN